MRRTNLSQERCLVARSLNEIGDWWTLLLVRDAFNGATRFGEFQRGLGLAKNILSARLRKMVADGIFELRAATDGSPHNEYHLTEKGLRLRVILIAVRQWGEDNLLAEGEIPTIAVEKASGEPIDRLRITAKDGRALNPLDVEIRDGLVPFRASGLTKTSGRAKMLKLAQG